MEYFEVSLCLYFCAFFLLEVCKYDELTNIYLCLQGVPGVPKIKEGYNPATWMLEVSSTSVEAQLDVDFAEIYANSDLFR